MGDVPPICTGYWSENSTNGAVLRQGNTAPFLWTRGRVSVDRAERHIRRISTYSENKKRKWTIVLRIRPVDKVPRNSISILYKLKFMLFPSCYFSRRNSLLIKITQEMKTLQLFHYPNGTSQREYEIKVDFNNWFICGAVNLASWNGSSVSW